MQSALSAPHFHNEAAAFAYVEAKLWPHGPVCHHCKSGDRVGALKGKTTRPGLYKCYSCRKPFTVRMGTVFESSHVPLRIWLQAIYLICSSKKGISTRQLQRTFGGSMKTAWFLMHRIREAMTTLGGGTMGGGGGVVEADETYFGKIEEPKVSPHRHGRPYKFGRRGISSKQAIVALVERGGTARVFHLDSPTKEAVHKIVRENVAPDARLHTDESRLYSDITRHVATHETVKHTAHEYARGDVTTNTVEGYFSVFKRGMVGIYQHCGEQHLHRYLTEFNFRYNTRIKLGIDDKTRADVALRGVIGKRLTYRTVGNSAEV